MNRDEERRGTRLPPDALRDLQDDRVSMVPFVPWRCPRCGDGKPRTYSQHGRVRLHQCQACGTKYRSLELQHPREWTEPAP